MKKKLHDQYKFKNILLVMVCSLVPLIFSAQNTISFDDQSYMNAQSLGDFSLTNNGVEFDFTSTSGTAAGFEYRTTYNIASGTPPSGYISSNGTNVSEIRITTADGSEFDFDGLTFVYEFAGFAIPETVVVEGFRDNVSTGSFSTVVNENPINPIDVSSNSDFENVDTIVVTETSGDGSFGVAGIDSVLWNTAVASNTAPVATTPSTPTVLEDATNVALEDDIQVSDADGDDQTVSFVITGGTLNLGTAGITFGGDGNGSSLFSAAGTLANINAALDAATFTPTADVNGVNAGGISFVANDGEDDSNLISLTFNITAVNDEPSFTAGANETVNEDAGAQTENAWATSISAGATNESEQTLSFGVTNDNNALFSTQPAIDASGNLTYTPAADASGSATVSVVLTDNGGTANGGDDTFATQQFTITVNPVNDEPSFTAGADETINEDAGAQTENGWATSINAGATNESGQTLSFGVTNDNNALFSTQPAIDTSGNLTYTPAADASGSATVSVVLTDNGGTANGGDDTFATQTFDITVNPVNDAPSFTPGANQEVTADASAQIVNGWATALSTGAVNESGQTLSFAVTTNNNALFTVVPAIDASGNLTYTPASGINGVATVNVVLSDDGGTANGGEDTFATQQFTITVNNEVLGTTDVALKTAFSFVNPVKTVFAVQTTLNISVIEVYSLSGVRVAKSVTNTLNVQHLASGVYVAVISTQEGIATTVKLVKD